VTQTEEEQYFIFSLEKLL